MKAIRRHLLSICFLTVVTPMAPHFRMKTSGSMDRCTLRSFLSATLKGFYTLFKQTEEFIKTNDKSTFIDILKIWNMPPFGIKKALHPILIMIFISANRKNLAVYHENVYVIEFSELLIDFVMRNLKDFSL